MERGNVKSPRIYYNFSFVYSALSQKVTIERDMTSTDNIVAFTITYNANLFYDLF